MHQHPAAVISWKESYFCYSVFDIVIYVQMWWQTQFCTGVFIHFSAAVGSTGAIARVMVGSATQLSTFAQTKQYIISTGVSIYISTYPTCNPHVTNMQYIIYAGVS